MEVWVWGLRLFATWSKLHGGQSTGARPGSGSDIPVVVPVFPEPIAFPRTSGRKEKRPMDGLPSLRKRVLVVDDDADGRRSCCDSCAQGAEYRLLVCTEALNVLETWRPDVLISDISMPDQNGYSCLRRCVSVNRRKVRGLFRRSL
jgi:PleD family two-component response regulator